MVLMDFTIRPANPQDAELLAELNEVVQQLHHEQREDWFKPPDPAGFLPVAREWLLSGSTAVFIAEGADHGPLGYCVGVRHERPENALVYGARFVELDQVVVIPLVRRLGLGSALCAAVLDWADTEGVDRVELSTWAFNDTAYKMFTDLGFVATVRRMSRSTRQSEQ